jgi:O-antigen/teichoic acid export membrane protein
MLNARIVNLGLRLVTMASTFLLTLTLARYLPPSSLGLYGLFAATVSLAIYAVGIDFYTFTTRELIRSDRSVWGSFIKNHFALAALLYGVILPLLMLLFVSGALPWTVAGWMLLILPLEHLSREISRLLIATSQQILASVVMFVRKGAWAWMLIALMYYYPGARNLSFVFGGWVVFCASACALGIMQIARMSMGGWSDHVDWRWIRKGVGVSGTLLVATLALQSLSFADKLLLQHLVGRDALGAYVLFFGLTVAIQSILDASVFSFAYPKLISAHHRGDVREFKRELWQMLVAIAATCTVISLLLFVGIDYLLGWIGRGTYMEHEQMLPWLLLATTLNCIAYVPHYGLYARGRDRAVVVSNMLGAASFFPLVALLAKTRPDLAVPIGLVGAFAVVLFLKTWCLLRHRMKTLLS